MKGRLRDLTKVETIYRRDGQTVRIRLGRRKIRTIHVWRKRAFTAPNHGASEVTTPAEAYEVFRAIYAGLDDDQEHFVMLVLDAASRVEGFKVIASGAQDGVEVACKYVFHSALLLGAHHIVVAHNHPSGSLMPSPADIELTSRLVTAGRVLEIPLLDHFILGRGQEHLSLYSHDPRIFVMSEDGPGT
jgi:DNA repair protein RadC